MANSQYEYVRQFEKFDALLPNTWIVVRIDGRSFHRFTKVHEFQKPNDKQALLLMNQCAKAIMTEFPDVVLSYGGSDEFSFVLRRSYSQYDRRESKLVTTFASIFASRYVFHWPEFFPQKKLVYPPCFDGRAVLYPTDQNLRDYLSWRQADCHINNLYNTTFWTLVQNQNLKHPEQSKLSTQEAEERLRGTFAKDKNEILFGEYGVNYNKEDDMFKKGSILLYDLSESVDIVTSEGQQKSKSSMRKAEKTRRRAGVSVLHVDLIGSEFWVKHKHVLET